jgi:hypothetical protein
MPNKQGQAVVISETQDHPQLPIYPNQHSTKLLFVNMSDMVFPSCTHIIDSNPTTQSGLTTAA